MSPEFRIALGIWMISAGNAGFERYAASGRAGAAAGDMLLSALGILVATSGFRHWRSK
jgi:hypothetical protein